MEPDNAVATVATVAAVAAENLTKYYSGFWGRKTILALDNLNLTVPRNRVFGLLGPNGSGKTTFVKLILGLLFPTSGKISALGVPGSSPRAKARIGYLPEESSLHSFMNANETLHFHGRLYGMHKNSISERTEELLDKLDLTTARRRRVREYSKGMARRLGLACALLHRPELLILDEPTSGLDPVGARRVKDILLELKSEGVSILLCSHLLSEVESVCDHIAVLEHGKLLKSGSIEEMLARPDILKVLLKLTSPTDADKYRKALEDAGAQVLEASHPSMTLEELFLQIIGKKIPQDTGSGGEKD